MATWDLPGPSEAGPPGPTGPTGPQGPIGPEQQVWWDIVDEAIAAATFVKNAGSFTVGGIFQLTKNPLTINSVDFYWENVGATSVKATIWDSGGTPLATQTVAGVSTAQRYSAVFATPLALSTLYTDYYVGLWQTDAGGFESFTNAANRPNPPAGLFLIGPNLLYIGDRYSAGDARPTTSSSGFVWTLGVVVT